MRAKHPMVPLAMKLLALLPLLLDAAQLAAGVVTVEGQDLCMLAVASPSPVHAALPTRTGSLLLREDGSAYLAAESIVREVGVPAAPILAAAEPWFTSDKSKIAGAVVHGDTMALSFIGDWDNLTTPSLSALDGVSRLASGNGQIVAVVGDRAHFFSPDSNSLKLDTLDNIKDLSGSDSTMTILFKNGTVLHRYIENVLYTNTSRAYEQIMQVRDIGRVELANSFSTTIAVDPTSSTVLHIRENQETFEFTYGGGVVIQAVGIANEQAVAILSDSGAVSLSGFNIPASVPLDGITQIAESTDGSSFLLLHKNGTAYRSDGLLLGENVREIGAPYLVTDDGSFRSLVEINLVGRGNTEDVQEVFTNDEHAGLRHSDGNITWIFMGPETVDYSQVLPSHMDDIKFFIRREGPSKTNPSGSAMAGYVSAQGDATLFRSTFLSVCLRASNPCLETAPVSLKNATVIRRFNGFHILDTNSRLATIGGLNSIDMAIPDYIDDVERFEVVGNGVLVVSKAGKTLAYGSTPLLETDCGVFNSLSQDQGDISGLGISQSSCTALIGGDLVVAVGEKISKNSSESFKALYGVSGSSLGWVAVRQDGAVFNDAFEELLGGLVDSEVRAFLDARGARSFWFENRTVFKLSAGRLVQVSGQFLDASCADYKSYCSGTTSDGELVIWEGSISSEFRIDLKDLDVVQVDGSHSFFAVLTSDGVGRLYNWGDATPLEEVGNATQVVVSETMALVVTKAGRIHHFASSSSESNPTIRERMKQLEPVRSAHINFFGTIVVRTTGEAALIAASTIGSTPDAPWNGVVSVTTNEHHFLLELEDGSGITVGMAFNGGNRCVQGGTQRPSPSPTFHPITSAPTRKPTSQSGALSRLVPVNAIAVLVAVLLTY